VRGESRRFRCLLCLRARIPRALPRRHTSLTPRPLC
jgi:hypothetical protein